MSDFVFDSELVKGIGGQRGSDSIRYQTPSGPGFLFASGLGSVWLCGNAGGVPNSADIGAHRFDVRSIPPQFIVSRVVLRLRAWTNPITESSPPPVFTSGPAWRVWMGYDAFEQQYQLTDLFAVKNQGGPSVLFELDPPRMLPAQLIEIDLDPAWVDPSRVFHDIEVEDATVYDTGYRYHIIQSGPTFVPTQLIVSAAPNVTELELEGGRQTALDADGGRRRELAATAGRRVSFAIEGGRGDE